jgi:2,3,4,5-tetrahydropyridine-2-carboxylate N-succinyltransferase
VTAGSGAELAGEALLDALESGEVRVAEPVGDTWRVNAWVKEAILALFRESPVVALGDFVDKAPLAVRRFAADAGVRLVPGGSAVRRGAHVGRGCVLMPPCYVNIGAFVDAGTMIDSHALVGSCAQIGRDVHVSAAAQVGGVLEPVGSRPVIVEDEALLGGGVGLYEGVRVGRRAVIAAGVVLTASTPVYDLSREQVLRGTADAPLEIPPDAVVVPGARPTSSVWGASQGVSLACAVIAKYRDGDTDAATALESALR